MTVLDERKGHGRLGLRGGMRLFEELVELPVYEKRVRVEATPALVLTDWTLDENHTYVKIFEESFQGSVLDVAAVQSLLDSGLVRVESLAECRSTPGSFFFQIFISSPSVARPAWDDAITLWDSTASWDEISFLYIHLGDESDPNGTTVVAKLAFDFASKGMLEPRLGVEKLTNGGFEQGFTDWTLGAGIAPITLETSSPISGSTSVRWDLSAPASNFRDLERMESCVAGMLYRLAFKYSASRTATIQVVVETPSGNFIVANGRDVDVAEDASILVGSSRGTIRRAIFDFLAPETGLYTLRLRAEAPNNPSAPATWDDAVTLWDLSPTVLWDDFGRNNPVVILDEVSLRAIFRFEYHEPIVDPAGVPQLSTGSRDIFFDAQQIGQGSIAFVNGHGFFEEALARFDWESHEMLIEVGGAFPDGEELLVDDFRRQFKAVVRRDHADNARASFQIEDVRSFILQAFPVRSFDADAFPNIDPDFIGKVRRVWFGPVTQIPPVRVDFTVDDFGVYELADPTDLPQGITSVDAVRAYATQDAADTNDPALQVALVAGLDFSVDLALARITILRDVQVIVVTAERSFLDWDQGGGPLQAQVALGVYTPAGLAAAISVALNSVGGGGKSGAYSQSSKQFTLAASAGTFSLLTNSGPNKANALWTLIGFATDADKTGSLSYLGDEAIFLAGDADALHILRVDGVGTRDTIPDGRFTGTSGDPIQRGADIARFVWEKYLRQPAALVDELSFQDARSSAPQVLGVYLDSATDFQAVFQRLQNSNRSNIVIDGDGGIRYLVNVPGVAPAGTVALEDSDFLDFSMDKALDDVVATVEVQFSRNPSTNSFLVARASDPSVGARFNRSGVRTFVTFLTTSTEAAAIAQGFLNLGSVAPRLASFTVKTQLLDRVEGEKVFITRRRGMDPTGLLNSELFRILLVQKSPDDASVQVLAVEDL